MKASTSVINFVDAVPRTGKLPKIRRDAVMSLRLPAEVKDRLQRLADGEGVPVTRFAQSYLDFLTEVSLDKAKAFAATVQDVQATYEKTVREAGEWACRLEHAVGLVRQQRTAYQQLQSQYVGLKAATLAGEVARNTTAKN